MMATQTRILLDGESLTVPQVGGIAHGTARVSVPAQALMALDAGHQRLVEARESRSVYGANTGVGANRTVPVTGEGEPGAYDGGSPRSRVAGVRAAHARRLLLSHCAAAGPVVDDAATRAAMAIRLNQLMAGGSGISSGVARGLLEALDSGSLPTLHGLGSIGMGDLPALAELALTLMGERCWRVGGIAPVVFTDSDALPFMSSSALTLATASLGASDLEVLLRAAVVVAALSFLALEGSLEAYDDGVHRRRAHPHQRAVAAAVARLAGGTPRNGARIQDPFGLRTFPQVHAPALSALGDLTDVLQTDINAATENPLVTRNGVLHHGQFHLAALAAALDHARTAFFPVLTLSSARLGMLFRPDMTRLPAFLAHGPAGSSGLMVAEYVVQDVLANVRAAVVPASGASLSLSFGLEDHAAFATQGARLLRQAAAEAAVVVAVEAVAAVRALRLAPGRLGEAPAREAFEYLAGQLDPDMADRPIGADIDRAVALLPDLANFTGGSL